MDELGRNILSAVLRHRVATRGALAAFLGAVPDKRLQRLVTDGYLSASRGLPGNRTVYQLARRGAAVVGASVARSRRLGAQSLGKHLGVLFFVAAAPGDRVRVEEAELAGTLGAAPPDGVHVLCLRKGTVVVLNCYVPGLRTPVATIHRHLRQQLTTVRKHPALADYIRDGRYGFAVVVDTAARRKAVMDVVRTPERRGRKPLVRMVRVWVEVSQDLGRFLGTNHTRDARHGDDSSQDESGDETSGSLWS